MPEINFSKLLTLKYWLEGTTAGDTVNVLPVEFGGFFFYVYVSIFSLFLILAILMTTAKLFLHESHPLQSKFTFLAQNTAWMGVLGFGWFACRNVAIAFLGARLWLLFGAVWVIVIAVWFAKYMIQYYPLEIAYFNKNKSTPVKNPEN